MGYHRMPKGNNDDDEDEVTFVKMGLESLDDLPPEIYEELVKRSMSMATRLKDRSHKLHKIMQEAIQVGKLDLEDAYWRTACIEQMAFFEMQIGNIHHLLETIINQNNK